MCLNPYIRYKKNYNCNIDSVDNYEMRPLVPYLEALKCRMKLKDLEFYFRYKYPDHKIIPCGRCLECKKRRSNEWTARLLMEFESKNNTGMMLTLTYDDSKLNAYNDIDKNPYRGITLIKKDVQNFIKRLRKHISKDNNNIKIKYYACGEYGSKTNRPHYHIVVLGYDFADKRSSCVVKSHKGCPLFVSDTLSDLWKFGLCTISNITSSSLQYVSKYIQKRQYGNEAHNKYENVLINHNVVNHRQQVYNLYIKPVIDKIQPEFSCMSTKTAIGYEYMVSNCYDLLSKFKFCIDKFKQTMVSLPRYFLKVLERLDVKLFEAYKIKLCFYIDKINKYTIDYPYRMKCALEHYKYKFDTECI